ncbi:MULTISPECIES: GntR family transcriptional regulator [unclassified Devosia]|uniref:GntR family transcriptional regulator n=1 Tax=unclassified Devosia TaxID=196773 RepID=UPI001ACAC4F6|nr:MULTISPECIES: GntR family transcriptional regulator [unclassified Devosia]MBN9305690.1 GntR family transcriptional regulator [Devosia sp.]
MTGTTRPVRGAGVQTVYERLQSAIVNLELPPGSPLDEVRLSKQFAMSRTPIREALVRLMADGLVTALPNRSTVVAPIDFEKLPVYFEALTLMYRVTTRAAALRRTPAQIEVIRAAQADYVEAVERSDAVGMISTNREFHLAIAEAGGNAYFTRWFTRLLDEGRRLLRLYYYASFDDHLPRKYVDEHEAMIVAIDKGDAERCDELATQHAAQIVKQIQSYIARDVTATMRLGDKIAPVRRSRK